MLTQEVPFKGLLGVQIAWLVVVDEEVQCTASVYPFNSQECQKYLPNSVWQNIENKYYCVKVKPNRFHLNGHTIGFRPQTEKLEQHVYVA